MSGRVKKPFVVFGDGEITHCNPIAQSDLARFMLNCIEDPSKHNRILNIGGPGEPLSLKDCGKLMFQAVGIHHPEFRYVPIQVMERIVKVLNLFAYVTRLEAMDNLAEKARIGLYYATHSMLTTDSSEKFGTITLLDHYKELAKGEPDEYDQL